MNRAIILTDGKAGHENQSKAFARAMGCDAELVPVAFRSRFAKMASYALSRIGIYTLSLFRESFDRLIVSSFDRSASTQPSNDKTIKLVVGTGSGTFYAAKALAKKLGVKCAVVLTPRGYDLAAFDCILSPQFDNAPESPNIVKIPVNLVANDQAFYDAGVTAFLGARAKGQGPREGEGPRAKGQGPGAKGQGAVEGETLNSQLSTLNSKAVAFIVGGPNKCSTMTAEWMRKQLDEAFAATPGCEHWVTTSRRTPQDVEAVIDSFPFDYKLIYSRDHFNPIPAFVMLADRLYVTAESTGMISEACSFGKAEVFAMDNLLPGPHKFRRFIESLRREGYVDGRRKVDLSAQFSKAKDLLAL